MGTSASTPSVVASSVNAAAHHSNTNNSSAANQGNSRTERSSAHTSSSGLVNPIRSRSRSRGRNNRSSSSSNNPINHSNHSNTSSNIPNNLNSTPLRQGPPSSRTSPPPPELGGTSSNFLLQRPYEMQRITTDATAFADGGPFPAGTSQIGASPSYEDDVMIQNIMSPALNNVSSASPRALSEVPRLSGEVARPIILRRVVSTSAAPGSAKSSSPYIPSVSCRGLGNAPQPLTSFGRNMPTTSPLVSKDRKMPPVKQIADQDSDIANSSNVASCLNAGPCLNPAGDVNSRLDTQVEVRVYPCNNNSGVGGKKKFTQFTVKPEGVIIQGTNRRTDYDLGTEYARHIGRKLQRYELADTRACQLLVTSHHKSFWVVPAPEAFSRHSGTCRLLGDRKHAPTAHALQVGDFLRVGSVGVVVIETHDGSRHRALSEEKIQRIMKDTASGGFVDLGETDGENSEASLDLYSPTETTQTTDVPTCYMCYDETDLEDNPLITPCKCVGDTRFVHVECLRKWHTAEADNLICFLSSVDATCSVCKSTFKSDFKLKSGKTVKLFKSSLEPPYVSLLVATKHEMAQRLFNTRFQLSFNSILKPDRKNSTRALLMGRSSGSDMVLDYRTVSARHASIRFKNNEFIFSDAGSSNGSYLYLRRPVELTSSQSVQFRLGRSMISMKVVNKWNRRLLRAVRRTHNSSSSQSSSHAPEGNDHSIGSDDEMHVIDGNTARQPRRTRESILGNLPAPGHLNQTATQHLDLLYALAYPKRAGPDSVVSSQLGRKLALKAGVSVGSATVSANSNNNRGESKEDEGGLIVEE